MLPLKYRSLRPFTYRCSLALGLLMLPVLAVAHDSDAGMVRHIAEHALLALWLLPILLLGVAGLLVRRPD